MGKSSKDSSKKHKKHKKSSKKSHKHHKKDVESNDSEEEIIWQEKGGDQAVEVKANQSSSSSDENETVNNKNDDSEWKNLFLSGTSSHVKKSLTEREQLKRENAKIENKARYSRELNSYFKDDVNKRFLDNPEEHWGKKAQSVAKEPVDESDDDQESSAPRSEYYESID